MNLRNIRLASTVASTLFTRFRELNNEQQRDVYEAVRIMARGGNGEDEGGNDAEEEDTTNFSEARLKAGDITRAAHARLDRRRALFDAEQLDKKEKKELEKALKKQQKAAKNKKKGGIALSALILALLAAAAGAAYYFIFGSDSPSTKKAKKGTAAKQAATPTVQRTQPPTMGSTGVTTVNATNANNATSATTTDHGPLSEEPAERDEELLSSIDEQLSTLETLDDEQRGGPDQR